jgi:tRNA (guanine26-N2/guanine27-N2)-dimethyltransferase
MYEEGKARIKYATGTFLNPAAKLSRDISVAFVNAVAQEKSKMLDATAATGIRGIRCCLETMAKDVTFLDINEVVFKQLKKNIAFNHVKAKAYNKSIQEFSSATRESFDLIDLDPFGGVTPYVYDLMKVSRDGTYLLVTATDTAVLCGAARKACIRLYDAVPMHNELCHEVGVRILAGYVARVAAQFNFGIEVKLALSYLHYMRIFVKLSSGAKKADASIGNIGYAYYCDRCHARHCANGQMPDRICKCCGNKLEAAGKLWVGSIVDKAVAGQMRQCLSKTGADAKELAFLETVAEESDIPLYYSIPVLTKKLGIGSVSPVLVMDALRAKGFMASKTHMHDSCIKSDAGIKEIEGIARELKQHV